MENKIIAKNGKKALMISVACSLLILTSACGQDYDPIEKEVSVLTEEKIYHMSMGSKKYSLSKMDRQIVDIARYDVSREIANASVIIETNDEKIYKSHRVADINKLLVRKGFSANSISYDFEKDGLAPSLNLRLQRRTVSLPENCPDWNHTGITNFDNGVMSNYGCANAINLGHMVANPNDLIRGRGGYGTETESSVSAVESFYVGDITSDTVSSGDDLSTVSDN